MKLKFLYVSAGAIVMLAFPCLGFTASSAGSNGQSENQPASLVKYRAGYKHRFTGQPPICANALITLLELEFGETDEGADIGDIKKRPLMN